MKIGLEIRKIFEQHPKFRKNSKPDVVGFAEKMGMKRQNAYRIFKKNDLDTDVLKRVSKLLDFDFFALLSNDLRSSYPHVKTQMNDEELKRLREENARVKEQNEALNKQNKLLDEVNLMLKEKIGR